MTERFEIFPQNVAKDGTLIIIQKGLKLYNISDVVDLLNELNDENEQLKDALNQRTEQCDKYYEENEQLKQSYTKLKHRHDLLHDEYVDAECERYSLKKDVESLEKENEQLKQVNRNLGDFRNFITEKNVSNVKQRKELQLQMLRLYNYFENYFEDAMGLTAFSEMWDNVKEDEKWEKR